MYLYRHIYTSRTCSARGTSYWDITAFFISFILFPVLLLPPMTYFCPFLRDQLIQLHLLLTPDLYKSIIVTLKFLIPLTFDWDPRFPMASPYSHITKRDCSLDVLRLCASKANIWQCLGNCPSHYKCEMDFSTMSAGTCIFNSFVLHWPWRRKCPGFSNKHS